MRATRFAAFLLGSLLSVLFISRHKSDVDGPKVLPVISPLKVNVPKPEATTAPLHLIPEDSFS